MSLGEELLALSGRIANLDNPAPTQAALRRAVSTAYYALFHLLISEATLNWGRPELRSELGRVFDHGKMKNASLQKRSALQPNRRTDPISAHLYVATDSFINLQQKRNNADYSTGEDCDQTDALKYIADVASAFESWNAIRNEPVAQTYLVSLFGARARSDH